jgi:hypothetical protein
MSLNQLRDTIAAARALAREYRAPVFIYRPLPDKPVYVITLDEETAAARCDAEGYTRFEANEEEETHVREG